MLWHANHLLLVNFIGNGRCTRSSLERMANGFFRDNIDSYLNHNIISVEKKDDPRDDLFQLTEFGKRLWRHEIKIEEIL